VGATFRQTAEIAMVATPNLTRDNPYKFYRVQAAYSTSTLSLRTDKQQVNYCITNFSVESLSGRDMYDKLQLQTIRFDVFIFKPYAK
jgi:hypothetical protein